MAHNLEFNGQTGTTSFVSANNEVAWHNLGQVLPQEFLTSEECIKYANMGYTVEKTPVYMNVGGIQIPVPDQFATYRNDNNHPFGVVGSKYTIVQNSDAFSFFDALVGEGAAIYTTAGVLGKGERIFLTAKLPKYCRIAGSDDIIELFIVLSMSHDGSGSIKSMITPIRVVCQNTLNMAIKTAINVINIRHTSSAQTRLDQAHKVLGLSNTYMDEFNEICNRLAVTPVKDTFVEKIIADLFPTAKDEVSTRAKNIRTDVMNAYFTGAGQAPFLGTAYGVYNGVTNYLNHVKNYGNPEKDLVRSNTIKFESIMEGQSAKIQQNCIDMLMPLIA